MPSRIRIGPDGGPYVIVEEDNGDLNISSPNGNVDFQGDDISNVGSLTADSVNTDETNNGRSGRFGDVVYYDPRDTGPYADMQDAADNVPAGGTLLLASTTIDAAAEGTVSFSEGATVEGLGWQAPSGALETPTGTVLDNQTSTIDQPLIEFSAANRIDAARVQNLAVRHEGDSPAIRFNDVRKPHTQNVGMYLYDSGDTGVSYDGDTFFIRTSNTSIRRYASIGFDVTPSVGSQNFFHNCHADADTVGAIGLKTSRPGTWVIGGEFIGNDAGLLWEAADDEIYGGGSVGTFHEFRGVGIDHRTTGTGNVKDVHHYSPRGLLTQGLDTLIRFGDCADVSAYNPVISNSQNATGELAEWSVDATRCGIKASAEVLRTPYTDNGAFRPWVEVDGRIGDFIAGEIAQSVPIFAHSYDGGGAPTPAFYDGSDWYELSSAATTFTP